MAKKRKVSRLPRVTVYALNRRELAAFVGAVEKLGIIVEDLRVMLEKKKSPKKLPVVPPIANEQGGSQ